MDQLIRSMTQATGLTSEFQLRVLETAAVVLVLAIGRALVIGIVHRRTYDVHVRYRWRKSATYVAVILGILLVGRIWFLGFQSLATFLGLLSAGLVVALKDVVMDLAGWLFILWRRPFRVGDRVEIGGQLGDVIDQRLFQFTMLEIGNWVDADQSTGRVIHVPNGKVFTEALSNSTQGFHYIWNELQVRLTFESDWRKARDILQEIADRHAEHLSVEAERRLREASERYLIFYDKLTPAVYTRVRDFGVQLSVRYLCEPRRRRGSEHALWEEILDRFSSLDDVTFAYPTQRFFDGTREGKGGVPAPVRDGREAEAPEGARR